jgi:hypothetical protein
MINISRWEQEEVTRDRNYAGISSGAEVQTGMHGS